MKDYGIVTVKKVWNKKRVTNALLILFLILFAIIALLTYYGQNVGCFTISMGESATQNSIFISTDPTFASYSPRLICDSLYEAQNTSYLTIQTINVLGTDGVYIPDNKSYIGYTFYIKNMGDETVNLQKTLSVNQCENNLDEAIWIWEFVESDSSVDTIYQKKDNVSYEYPNTYRNRSYFLDDRTVFKDNITSVEPDEVIKVSLIIWVEGEDPDTNRGIIGGKINFNLEYSLVQEDN